MKIKHKKDDEDTVVLYFFEKSPLFTPEKQIFTPKGCSETDKYMIKCRQETNERSIGGGEK